MKRVIMLATVLAILSVTALAKEKKVTKAELPAAVQKTADQQSAGATVKGYEADTQKGKTTYEVELSVNGKSKDVSINPDGSVAEVEEEVTMESLPAQVRDSIKKAAGSGKIGKIEATSKDGKVSSYEAHVTNNGKHSEIKVGPSGAVIR